MKKLFVALCSVLLGGFFLLVAMFTFTACARLQYQDPAGNVRIRGITLNPEAAMIMSAEAEAVRAQAYATRKCSDDPRNCGAVWGGWGAYGFAPPEEVAVKQYLASQQGAPQQGSLANQRDDLREIKQSVVQIKNSQRLLIKAMKGVK